MPRWSLIRTKDGRNPLRDVVIPLNTSPVPRGFGTRREVLKRWKARGIRWWWRYRYVEREALRRGRVDTPEMRRDVDAAVMMEYLAARPWGLNLVALGKARGGKHAQAPLDRPLDGLKGYLERVGDPLFDLVADGGRLTRYRTPNRYVPRRVG